MSFKSKPRKMLSSSISNGFPLWCRCQQCKEPRNGAWHPRLPKELKYDAPLTGHGNHLRYWLWCQSGDTGLAECATPSTWSVQARHRSSNDRGWTIKLTNPQHLLIQTGLLVDLRLRILPWLNGRVVSVKAEWTKRANRQREGARDPAVYLDHSNVVEQCWTHCVDCVVEVSLNSSTAMSEHGSRIALTKFPPFKHGT